MKNRNRKLVKEFELENKETILLINELPKNLIKQLIKYSNEDEVVRQSSSDAKRFKDENAFNKWLEKGRIIYAVTDKNQEELLGIFWFGFRPLVEEKTGLSDDGDDNFNITVAYRLYEKLRGKRMFTKLFNESISHFINSKYYKEKVANNQGDFWLETNLDNKNSLSGAQKIGFKIIGTNPNNKRAILIGKTEKILQLINNQNNISGLCR